MNVAHRSLSSARDIDQIAKLKISDTDAAAVEDGILALDPVLLRNGDCLSGPGDRLKWMPMHCYAL